jgi:hypothetical protein
MTTPDPQLDRVADLSREFVQKAGAIALQTNDDIGGGSFDLAKWAKSMLDLFDLALTNSAAIGPDTCMPCIPIPGLPSKEDDAEHSDYIEVNPDPQNPRIITAVPGSFTHDGDPNFVIPYFAISFEPAVLKPLATQFQICVTWDGLRNGTYHGKVRLVPESGTGTVTEEPVIIDL